MTYTDLTRRLSRLGVVFRRQARGSHEVWWHPGRQLYTMIPNHRGDLKKGTLAKILRDLGISEDDLRGA